MSRGPVRVTMLVGIVLLLVLVAVLWLFVLSPRLSTASEINDQAATVATQNQLLQNRYQQALRQAREAPQSAAEAVALFETMPQEADLPAVLDQITAAALDAGLRGTDLISISTSIPQTVVADAATTQPAAGGIELATIDLQVSAQGRQEDLLVFLDNLRTLDRAALVTSSALTTSAEGGDSLTVQAQLFVLRSQLPDIVAQVEDLLAQAELPIDTAPPASPAASPVPTTG